MSITATSEFFSKYDLTPLILRYLDRHLAIELLNAISLVEPNPYDTLSLQKAQYSVCKKTKLFGDAQDLVEIIFTGKEREDKLASLHVKQAQTKESYDASISSEGPIGYYMKNIAIPEGQEKVKQMIKDQTIALEGMEVFNLKPKDLEELVGFARRLYEYGQYDLCGQILRFVRLVDPATYKQHSGRLWGQLACGILQSLNGGASLKDTIEDLAAVNDFIDIHTCELNTVLFFLHWALLVFLLSGNPAGREQLLEVFMSEKYLPVIRHSAPHLLRYICVAMLTLRGQRRGGRMSPALKSFREFLESEAIAYSDPILDVVHSLLVKCDARAALEHLRACDTLLKSDYFLIHLRAEFIECVRRFCFEDICRLHQTIDLQEIAKLLNFTVAEAERWIVNVIRPARINAKVDSARQVLCVQVDNSTPSASHLIMDKTQMLSFRVHSLHKTCVDSRAPPAPLKMPEVN